LRRQEQHNSCTKIGSKNAQKWLKIAPKYPMAYRFAIENPEISRIGPKTAPKMRDLAPFLCAQTPKNRPAGPKKALIPLPNPFGYNPAA